MQIMTNRNEMLCGQLSALLSGSICQNISLKEAAEYKKPTSKMPSEEGATRGLSVARVFYACKEEELFETQRILLDS